jgi:hypothetical protein
VIGSTLIKRVGLHALRHTFVTDAGEYTSPFTLQYVAGHDNIKTSMRCIHSWEGCGPPAGYTAGGVAATEGASQVQGVGAKSGAAGNARRSRPC